MRALVIEEFGRPGTIQQIDRPDAAPDGVVVKVAATGVCRSDWHAWQGHDSDVRLPFVPGHEFAGTVVSVGSDVDPGWIGKRVTTPFVCACGTCSTCAAGDQQVCPHQEQPGFTHDGSYAEFVALRYARTNLVALPDSVSFDVAATLGCRYATAWRAVHRRARVVAGERVG
ncbi:MAG: alcohol dehydrogenase catalytic domain-containing protein, partial [Rhodococcus sp. (in: high G+C Gram-positive bacteria)]